MTKEQAEAVYKILVSRCAANASKEQEFVDCVTDPNNQEYRFGGELGFGGKFFHSNSRWWVSCYKENGTVRIIKMMNETNRELTLLKLGMDPLGSIARCLHERYSKRYPNRYVEIEPNEEDDTRLCVMFRHSNSPYRPYLRITLKDAIILDKKVKTPNPPLGYKLRWTDTERVPFEDPEMEEKLDILVARVVETTSQLEM